MEQLVRAKSSNLLDHGHPLDLGRGSFINTCGKLAQQVTKADTLWVGTEDVCNLRKLDRLNRHLGWGRRVAGSSRARLSGRFVVVLTGYTTETMIFSRHTNATARRRKLTRWSGTPGSGRRRGTRLDLDLLLQLQAAVRPFTCSGLAITGGAASCSLGTSGQRRAGPAGNMRGCALASLDLLPSRLVSARIGQIRRARSLQLVALLQCRCLRLARRGVAGSVGIL